MTEQAKHMPGPWYVSDLRATRLRELGWTGPAMDRILILNCPPESLNATTNEQQAGTVIARIQFDNRTDELTDGNAADAALIAAAPETAAERDRLKEENAELVEALKYARECIAYCRRAHPDIQTGDGIPAEIFIDEALAKREAREK